MFVKVTGPMILGGAIALLIAASASAEPARTGQSSRDGASSRMALPAFAAATDERCTLLPFNEVCVNKTNGQVFGVIYGGPYFDLTQVVYQCDGLGHNCGVFIASHGNPTSSKPVSYGHVYKNCAGFTDVDGDRRLNVCSPFVTGS
jgi:hypothetical protein